MVTDTLNTANDTTARTGGLADQLSGGANRATDAVKDAYARRDELTGKAKAFAKERPWATAALAGVVGMALLNTLRGR